METVLIANLNLVAFAMCFAVATVATLRYFTVSIFARLSWWQLVAFVVVLNIGYATLLSYGQYVTWSADSVGKTFLTQPLSGDTPLPFLPEWARDFFEQPLGYFSFYIFGRFFFPIIILFTVTIAFVILLHFRARYRPINFKEGDIMAIAIALLISGWPGILVLVPLSFLFAVVISICARFYGIERVRLSPAFLLASPFSLIFATQILTFLNLYAILKL